MRSHFQPEYLQCQLFVADFQSFIFVQRRFDIRTCDVNCIGLIFRSNGQKLRYQLDWRWYCMFK